MKSEIHSILAFTGGALLVASNALAGPPAEYAGSETFTSDRIVEAQFVADQIVQPQGCNTTFYDSGDAFVFNTGRTVGTTTMWEVYQPFMLAADYELCAIATDGWYVTGSPTTFRGSIFPDNAGTPDITNELAGADYNLGGSGSPDWVTHQVTPVCLQANTLYYFGARATGDHWSAIYRDTVNGGSLMQSFSIRLGNFGERFSAPPICLKLYGVQGCGGGGPSLRISGDCPGRVTVAWADATPSRPMGIALANGTGNFVIPGGACAGTQTGLSSAGIQLVYQGNTGANGSGQVSSNAGTGACRKYLQMFVVDGSPCAASNVVQIP